MFCPFLVQVSIMRLATGAINIFSDLIRNGQANLEILWYFTGINVFMMTFAVFVIVQKIKINASPLLSRIASLTLGIYLAHFFFLQVSFDLIYENIGFPDYLKIPLLALLTFGITYSVVWTLSKFNLTRKVIM